MYLIFLPGGTEQDCDNFGPEPTLRQRRVEESGSDIDSQHPRYGEREETTWSSLLILLLVNYFVIFGRQGAGEYYVIIEQW